MTLTPRLYTLNENDFLRQNYHIIGPVVCSQQLGRTYQSIVTQANRLGLKSNKFKQASDPSINKVCGRCQVEKSKTLFGNDKNRKDKLHPICKECLLTFRKKHTQQKSIYDANYRTKNHVKILNYRRANAPKIRLRRNTYNRRWRLIPQNKILGNLRTRLRIALKHNKKVSHTVELLGCSISELKQHLEKQFVTGMSWDNYGKGGWHVDHIKPCSSFNLSDPKQQKECFHFSNMQPLWEKDNLLKGAKLFNQNRH